MASLTGTAVSVRDEVFNLVASESDSPGSTPDPDASFTALGFDSLGLMRLAEIVEQRFGLVVSFRSLMGELCTAHRLAEYLAAHASCTASQTRLDPSCDEPPSPLPKRGSEVRRKWNADAERYRKRFLERALARMSRSQQMAGDGCAQVSGSQSTVCPCADLPPLRCPAVTPIDGCRVRDADGNQYVDLSMGWGAFLFGYGSPFTSDALLRQISKGYALGPQPEVAGEVAEQICALTGVDRVTFCNSGTEAILAALRIARAVTRRNRMVAFAGSDHGSFDGAQPDAPGAADVLTLEYGDPASLEVIRREGGTLAAVLVEPVPSRRPHLVDRKFLNSLREITKLSGAALIFDEVTTGFRCQPAGAQGYFGIRADLVTYGKALGGGMPIGVVAGAARFMDAIDGGSWSFDDDTAPYADQTFFAGTFCKHPLVMSSAAAFLEHLRGEGAAALAALNGRVERLAARVNGVLDQNAAPIRLRHFSSWFVFEGEDPELLELFRQHLLCDGVFVWGDGPCFLSTAHDDREMDRIAEAVGNAAAALRDAGVFAAMERREAVQPGQREIWAISQFGAEASAAFNESATLRMRGRLDLEALRSTVKALVERHDALRTTFSADGDSRVVHSRTTVPVPVFDLADDETAALQAIQQRIAEPFHLQTGPLLRTELLRRSEEDHTLLVIVHHLITDGFSMGVLLEELAAGYAAAVLGARWEPRVIQATTADDSQSGTDSRDEEFWARQLAGLTATLTLPADFPRPAIRTFLGGRVREGVRSVSAGALRSLAAERNVTTFSVLLSGYALLLHHLARQDDIIVGSAAGAPSARTAEVGFFVTLLPIRSRIAPGLPFSEYLNRIQEVVLGMQEHPRVSLAGLAERVGLHPNPPRPGLVSATFAVERPSPPISLPGLTVEADTPETGFSKYDLTLNVDDLSLTCDWTFNRELFRRARVERWAAQFDALLAEITRDPNARVGDLAGVLDRAASEWLTRFTDALAHTERSELGELKRR